MLICTLDKTEEVISEYEDRLIENEGFRCTLKIWNKKVKQISGIFNCHNVISYSNEQPQTYFLINTFYYFKWNTISSRIWAGNKFERSSFSIQSAALSSLAVHKVSFIITYCYY